MLNRWFDVISFFIRKILIVIAMICCASSVFAQKPRQAYCEVIVWVQQRVMHYAAVNFDFGMQTYTTAILYDTKNEPLRFVTGMDAINYLSKRGWKVISTYYNPNAGRESVHYLMEKTVTDEKQVKEGLVMKLISLDEFYKMYSLPKPSSY